MDIIMHCGQPVEYGRKDRVTQEQPVHCLACDARWTIVPQRSGW